MGIRLGIDIGGTFTDFTAIGESGEFRVFKTLSTPHAPEEAIASGIAALADEEGLTEQEFLSGVDLLIHGTTIALNTVIKRDGPKLGLLNTEGFRDILYLRDGHKPDRYNLQVPPVEPLVPRYLRLGVPERVDYQGEVLEPLDEDAVRGALRTFAQEGVESIAVSLLWSMLNPAHEQRVLELVREEMPDAYVALSSDILPAIREYPRTSATVLSAYVGPVLGTYLSRLDDYLRANGYRNDLLIMQVTGGPARVQDVERRPVLAIGSGPAAGPAAALAIGAEENERNLMLVEMGGTSFDVSLATEGEAPMSAQLEIDGMPLGVSAVDVHSVGAGGGSIAWLDAGGMLRVGPRSAGADPGPACYGLGGVLPTVTDADLVLGYLSPDNFLGGRMVLDRTAAEHAIGTIAEPLGMDVVEAAAAIYRIVNTEMVGAMRAVSVMRGVDPRGYTVVVGGGAGGTHAARIAEELGMTKAICPQVAGALCSYGMLAADVRQSYLSTFPTTTAKLEPGEANRLFGEMEERARSELRGQGFDDDAIELRRSIDAKYPYQMHEITVPAPSGDFTPELIETLASNFHDEHERLYTYCLRDMPVDVNAWRVTALGKLPALPMQKRPVGDEDPSAAERGVRSVYFEQHGGFVDTRIFDGEGLQPGMKVVGPAVAELPTTTVVLFPGHRLTVNGFGDFHIDITPEADSPGTLPATTATAAS
jgi:N-methylhydantoinase A